MENKEENKICQNCKQNFTIEPSDFSFYEKIKVPPPTFCPECRMIRRMVWRNFRSLYKRLCGLCGKNLISMYPDDGAPVYCTDCFSGDKWNPLSTGFRYDFSRPFFSQFHELFLKAPRAFAYHTGALVNSDFTNYSADNKNVYLSYSAVSCEDVMYSDLVDKTKNSLDCLGVKAVENCSQNTSCDGNYNCHFAVESRSCIDSYFIYDCVNSQDCALSSNLRNQRYVFKNKKLSKEEYKKALIELKLNTNSGIQTANEYFNNLIRNKTLHRFAQILNSQNATGEHIANSRGIKSGFDVKDSENIAFASRVILNSKDSYDALGLAAGELMYETVASSFGSYKNFFCYIALGSRECEYSMILRNCSDCFGCVGLTNAQYCIFNKQFKKEEYFEMVDKIKQHMKEMPYIDRKGRTYVYGEFFPFEFSPFSYNEATTLDYFPITKEKADEMGYVWREKEKISYKTTISSENLPDSIEDVSDSIFSEVIACPNNGNSEFQCTSAFKIVPNEFTFYKKHALPLPRFCPNCRHYQRLKYRNPMKLWKRKCMKDGCQNEFETSYSPERPEIVYCEKCYQQEVY